MTSEFAIAVHALVYLNRKQEVQSSEILAGNICTNPARIRKIMGKLKKHGLIGTKEGINGGYYALENAEEINLKEICDALETDLIRSGWKTGNKDLPCMIASGMADVMDGLYHELDAQCKQYLGTIRLKEIDHKIFEAGEKER